MILDNPQPSMLNRGRRGYDAPPETGQYATPRRKTGTRNSSQNAVHALVHRGDRLRIQSGYRPGNTRLPDDQQVRIIGRINDSLAVNKRLASSWQL